MSRTLECAGLLVDPKPQAVAYYERFGFQAAESIEGQAPDRPEPTAMFLHIETITSAIEG